MSTITEEHEAIEAGSPEHRARCARGAVHVQAAIEALADAEQAGVAFPEAAQRAVGTLCAFGVALAQNSAGIPISADLRATLGLPQLDAAEEPCQAPDGPCTCGDGAAVEAHTHTPPIESPAAEDAANGS